MTVAPTRIERLAAPPIIWASRLIFGEEPQVSPGPAHLGDEAARSLPKPRALVVDDAPDVTEMLSFLLRYAGYEVVAALSGPQALDAAREQSFDVVVSDIGMPGMSGYELAERLRALAEYRQTPLIAVTGFSMYDDRDRAFAAGFDAFVNKPVNPRELVSLIESLRG
ncbi:MAG TPA: response regulator [Pyrinomonadaceae bacterium]|nr:response regulator [Pyrinomonadaceae bacterium]